MSTPVTFGNKWYTGVQNYPILPQPGATQLPLNKVAIKRVPSVAITVEFYVPGKSIAINGGFTEIQGVQTAHAIPYDDDPNPLTNGGRATQMTILNRTAGVVSLMDAEYSP